MHTDNGETIKGKDLRDAFSKLRKDFPFMSDRYELQPDLDVSDLRPKETEFLIREAVDKACMNWEDIPLPIASLRNARIGSVLSLRDVSMIDSILRTAPNDDTITKTNISQLLHTCRELPLRDNLEDLQKSMLDNIPVDEKPEIAKPKRKLCKGDYIPVRMPNNSIDINEPTIPLDPDSTVIMTVQIKSCHRDTLQQELDMLGNYTLGQLRDSIYCIHSQIHSNGAMNDSFFFIGGNFYIDPHSCHRSKCNIASIKKCRGKDKGPPEKLVDILPREMQEGCNWSRSAKELSQDDTLLEDLEIELGKRYVFCHDFGCEHFIYFTDIHMFSKTVDLPNEEDYPRLTQQAKMKRRKCFVCDVWSAKFVVYNDRLSSENPTFYCQHCYHCLHYSVDDQLLYNDFEVYPYLHDMV